FTPFFLRDSCRESSHVNPISSQKLFSSGELGIPANQDIVTVEKCEIIQNSSDMDTLKVFWRDGHVSQYPENFLRRYSTVDNIKSARYGYQPFSLWNKTSISEELSPKSLIVSYDEYMNTSLGLYRTLKGLHSHGLVFLRNIPHQPINTNHISGVESLPVDNIIVERIAERIGYIKETFYGTSWDVKSIPNAKNIAYTSSFLPLHMDLLYYESPPGLQYLHVIENQAKGGESIFVDSFAAVKEVERVDKVAFEALKRVPVTYQYDNDGEYYYQSRPMVIMQRDQKVIEAVNYSPPFQGPFECHTDTEGFKDFQRGLAIFESFIEDPKNQVLLKMEENSCVIFQNRRVLHSRNEFDQMSGKRWFRGTYNDIDTFWSRLRVMARE
ncbi:Clavaminate synthase-like protein, partial [Nadsonia fulvescens var. elongata DSM 6958]